MVMKNNEKETQHYTRHVYKIYFDMDFIGVRYDFHFRLLHNPQVCTIINVCVRPSTVSENAYNLNRIIYFDKILHTYTCQHCLKTGMHNSLF